MFELHEIPDSFFVMVGDTIRSGSEEAFSLVSLIAFGFSTASHISSSAGVRVFCISEVRVVSHRLSLVHMSSILLSAHNCPMVSSPFSEGNSHPFGTAWAMPLYSVFHTE